MRFSFVTSGRKQNWLLTGPFDIRRASSKQPTVLLKILQQAPSLVLDKERVAIHAIHHQPAMPQSTCRRDFSDRPRLANQRRRTRHTALSTASFIREFGIISFR